MNGAKQPANISSESVELTNCVDGMQMPGGGLSVIVPEVMMSLPSVDFDEISGIEQWPLCET